MGNNRFLDNDVIVVPSNNNNSSTQPPTPVPVNPEPIPQPTPVTPNQQVPVTPDNSNKVTPNSQQNVITDKGKEYFNIVNQFVQSQDNTTNQNDKPQPKPEGPMYNYVKDPQTGKVIIQTINNNPTPVPNDNLVPSINVTDEKQQIILLLNNTQQDIVKCSVEIKLFLQLLKEETDINKKKIYEGKLKSLRDDFDYNQRRKSILESML